MHRRAALALVRAPSLAPALRLPALRRPSARAFLLVLALAAAAAGAYALARETSIFAVRTVDLEGATPAVAADLRPVLAEVSGSSLVALDRDELVRRLRAVPSVRAATVDRAFPYTLEVSVVPERPLAIYRDGAKAWLIAASGRVVRPVEPTALPRLPRVRIELPRVPEPGAMLKAPEAAALAVLRSLPRSFPPVLYAAAVDGEVGLQLRDGPQVRLGPPLDLGQKLRAAKAVLASLTPEDVASIEYLDASLPERVVTDGNSELSSDGLE